MAGLKVKIGADASQFERTMRGVRKDIGGVKNSILGIGSAVGAIWAVNKAFDAMRTAAGLAFQEIKASSREAAGVEDLSMQFETLLGSAGAAEDRISDLVDFAASTPFEISKLGEASAMLQGMTQGALAAGDGLKLVGDAAAAVNKPIDVVGRNIGLLYQGLTQGGEVAEATNQLMQYGLVSGKTKIELQNFVKEAKAGDIAFMSQGEALEKLQSILGKTEGAMERLAETTNGKISMMKDAVWSLRVSFGEGFNEGLKDALDATTNFLPQFQGLMVEAGRSIGMSLTEAVEGDKTRFVAIGQYIGSFIAEGIERAATAALSTAARISEAVVTLGGTEALRLAGQSDWTASGQFASGGEIGDKWNRSRANLLASVNPQQGFLDAQAAIAASNQLGLGGFNPFRAGSVGDPAMTEDMKQVRRMMEQVVRNISPSF